MTALLY